MAYTAKDTTWLKRIFDPVAWDKLDVSLKDVLDTIQTQLSATDVAGSVTQQFHERFQDVPAKSATAVHAAVDGTGGAQTVTTAITNPNTARSVTVTTTNNNSPSGNVVVTGVDAQGAPATDTITVSAGAEAGGVVPFATVSQFTVPAGIAAAVAATGTVAFNSPSDGDTVEVDGTTFTYEPGSAAGAKFNTITALTSDITGIALVSATDDATTITVTADTAGAAGNAITMASTGAALTLSGATLAGGSDAVASTATVEVVNQPDLGTAADATITVVSQPDVLTAATGTVTVATQPNVLTKSTATVEVVTNPNVLTAASGTIIYTAQPSDADAFTVGSTTFEFDTGDGVTEGRTAISVLADADTTWTAAKNAISALASVNATIDTGTNTITITAATAGTGGNSIILVEVTDTGAVYAVSGATLTGGLAADTMTVGGQAYTFVSGAPGAGEIQKGVNTDATAANIETAIDTDTATTLCTASTVASTLTLTANTGGTAGDSITLTTDGVRITDTNFSGGLAADTITVGGETYTFVSGAPGASEIQVGAGVNDTATNIETQVDTDTATTLCTGATVANAITLTANTGGTAGNSITLTTDGTRVTKVAFAGGLAADTITIGGNAYTFVSGAPGALEIQVGAGINDTAANIETSIDTDTAATLCTASTVANVLTLTANTAGTGGNTGIALTTDGTRVTKVAFANGAAGDTLAVGGKTYTFTGWTPVGDEIAIGANQAACAANVETKIDADTATTLCTSSTVGAVLTLTANTAGVAGDSITLTSDGVRVTDTNFSGGADAVAATGTITYGAPVDGDTMTMNGTAFTCALAVTAGNSFTTLAGLTADIDALATVSATDDATTITITATTAGAAGNALTLVAAGGFTVSGAGTLTGGSDADTVSVGTGDLLGLANKPAAGSDIYKYTKNNAAAALPTYSATYGTLNCATITGNDDFEVWYKMSHSHTES